MPAKAKKSATSHDIRAILGPTDDDIVTSILSTGATRDEVLQAFEWLDDDDYMGADLKKPMNSNIRRIYEILQEDRDKVDPDVA